MSADISAARGVSAPETSEALWATDGLDLSTDESYAAGSGLAQPPATAAGRCHRGTAAGAGGVVRAQWADVAADCSFGQDMPG